MMKPLEFETLPAAGAPLRPELDELSGVVERVTYRSEASGFSVLRVRVPDRPRRVAVVGRMPSVVVGETITARGHWARHGTHGLQFQASSLATALASSPAGLRTCLGSGLIKGIGPAYAGRLVRAFGEDVLEVIEREPHRLREVAGIGAARARRIVEAWADQRAARELMLFLHDAGVGVARTSRILRAYGARAIEIIREDPYCLARDFPTFGFLAADTVARRLGIEPHAPIRVRAGIGHVLAEAAAGDGHCGLPVPDLLAQAERLLGVPAALIETVLAAEAKAGAVKLDVTDGRECAFAAELYRAERAIADRLRMLAGGSPPWPPIDPGEAVRRVEIEAGAILSDSQRRAIATALGAKVAVITGGPGVGKTMLVNALCGILGPCGIKVALTAPTGRAAKRLADVTGLEARTLHRLLEFDPAEERFRRNRANPLACDLVVVDEMSMVDVPLMAALLDALPERAGLLMVGDADQLPSIGPGQVLADVIASGAVATAQVTEVFRQISGSAIIASAHRIKRGRMPDLTRPPAFDADFYVIGARTAEQAVARIVDLAAVRVPRRFGLDPIRDIQVLSPTNLGPLGTRALNVELQRALNPTPGAEVARSGWVFGTGDRVMQTENDYDREVYNGDLGTVARVDPDERLLQVDFGGRTVAYGFDELDQLALAYATTVHKAQGSEYPAVVMPIMARHSRMLNRNLIYTAVTRGSGLVVLVGERVALEGALAVGARRRHAKLRDWLQADGASSRHPGEGTPAGRGARRAREA